MKNENLCFVSEQLSKDEALEFLRRWLIRHFDSNDQLRILSEDLNIPYGSLIGENANSKAHDLVKLIIRRQRVPNLINYLRDNDPTLLEILVGDVINSKCKSNPINFGISTEPETATENKEIYLSDNRGGGKDVVNHLDKAFQRKEVTIIRSLSESEIKKIIDRYIGVSDGYLGDFNHRTHADFYPDYCGLDIDPNDYQKPGDEKRSSVRKRFTAILETSPPLVQAKIIRGVLKRFTLDATDKKPITRTQELYEKLEELARRLENFPNDLEIEAGTATKNKEIFISYKWGGRGEDVVNHLDEAFQSRKVTIIRDKRNVGYKEDIKKFMECLGRGKCVIVVICDQYLRSHNCMFELIQIAKNGNFCDRIFPIVMNDARINKADEQLKYLEFWNEEIEKLNNGIQKAGSANLGGIREELDLYTEIRANFSNLASLLKGMNTLDLETHSKLNFEIIFKSIADKLSE
jgi:TIR domain